jgi:hypothetical protein
MAENEELRDQEQPTTIFKEEELLVRGYDKQIKEARNILFAVGGITIVFKLVPFFAWNEPISIISFSISIFTALVFIGLGVWTKKKPVTAILIGLVFYCLISIMDLVFQPWSISGRLVFKILVVIYLARGLINAKNARQTQQALGK